MNRSFIVFLIITFSSVSSKADIIDDISNLFKAGNTTEISKYLAPRVELGILSDQNSYQKAQATAALNDFFKKNQPSSAKVVHKLTSNPNHLFAVMLLNTNNGIFRTSFSVVNTAGKYFITEISFETNKD
jgi:hypothetical protein